MEVVASLSQGRTAAAQWGLFTYKSVPVIFEPPCICPVKKFGVLALTFPIYYQKLALNFIVVQYNKTAGTDEHGNKHKP